MLSCSSNCNCICYFFAHLFISLFGLHITPMRLWLAWLFLIFVMQVWVVLTWLFLFCLLCQDVLRSSTNRNNNETIRKDAMHKDQNKKGSDPILSKIFVFFNASYCQLDLILNSLIISRPFNVTDHCATASFQYKCMDVFDFISLSNSYLVFSFIKSFGFRN